MRVWCPRAFVARVAGPVRPESSLESLGPRTTVLALLEAYPFLTEFLVEYDDAFRRLERPGALRSWARVTNLGLLAITMDVSWRRLLHDIASEVARVTGEAPRVLAHAEAGACDQRRLGEVRDIIARLEAGAPLPDLARELKAVTADLSPAEAARLYEALGNESGGVDRRLVASAPVDVAPVLSPPGHPLDTAAKEAAHVRRLCADLRVELERLGGSPTRRRWRDERSLVGSLVDQLSDIEWRFRRQQQAWFPALAVHGVDGPATLLVPRQREALERLRRLRLAIGRDDAVFVVEIGHRLLGTIDGLLLGDEQVLAPLAQRCFTPADWAAVRELEDGVGWGMLPAPPPWPLA